MKTVLVIRTGGSDTWQEKLAGLLAYARGADWKLQFVDARAQRPNVARLIGLWKPIGVIIDASGWIPANLGNLFGRTPFVLLHPRNPEDLHSHSCVIGDPEAIARLAAQELLGRSLQSIAFLEWHEEVSWVTSKREAFRKIADMSGMKLHVITPSSREIIDPTVMGKHIAERLARLPRPCGVFAIFDVIGALAVSSLSRLGYEIPRDYSIVSVDDDASICESCSPTLSSIRPDYFRVGFSAGDLLAQKIKRPRAAQRTVKIGPSGLTRRASSRIMGKIDQAVSRALEHIRVNACNGLTPKDILVFFGKSSLRSSELRFKAVTGKSIASEILDVRLARACDYLKTTSTSIQAIANFCGWKSPVAFRKAFHSRFGMPPRDWAAKQPTGLP